MPPPPFQVPLAQAGQAGWANMRADFNPTAFGQAINTKGYRARWEKNVLCPARGEEDIDRHLLTCTVCDNGYIYYDPITVEAQITSLNLKEFFRTEGRFDVGTALVTLPAANRLSFWDKVTLLDARHRYTEVFKRAVAGVVDKLSYDILEMNRLIEVRNDAIVEYTEGLNADFVIDGNFNILWNNPPPANTVLSASYMKHPAYIILDMVHNIRDTQVKQVPGAQVPPDGSPGTWVELPQQGMGKLDFMVKGRNPADTPVTP